MFSNAQKTFIEVGHPLDHNNINETEVSPWPYSMTTVVGGSESKNKKNYLPTLKLHLLNIHRVKTQVKIEIRGYLENDRGNSNSMVPSKAVFRRNFSFNAFIIQRNYEIKEL